MREQGDLQLAMRRLAALESQNRRLKQRGICAFVALAGLLLMGQTLPQQRVLEAERFYLRDGGGRNRAELSLSEDRSVNLLLRDRNEKIRAWLGVSAAGAPRLELRDARGLPRVELEVDANDLLRLDLSDVQGRERVHLEVGAGGAPLLELSGAGDGFRNSLQLQVEDAPQLRFYNRDTASAGMGLYSAAGTLRAGLSVAADGTPRLIFLDAAEEIVFGAPE